MEPIIVIVGFLGAGKTTLLKKLTKDYLLADWKPFIILNDYQNANIDRQQFLDVLARDQIEALSGSCICCSGVNELRQKVNDIPSRDKGITFIEANGTTDACTLMEFLGVGIKGDFNPPVQITVVDARNWQKRDFNNELEANQLQVSSLVVLNYADRVDEIQLEKIKSEIRFLNPSAIIKEWNQIDSLLLPELKASKNHYKTLEHMKSHWASCSVDLPDPFPSKKLEFVMKNLPDQILRVKGCTRLDDDNYYSFFERTPAKETFIRPYTGDLVTGPKLLVVGPGSDPETLLSLINAEDY